MAKIERKEMKIFGSTAGVNEIGQFGSLAAGSIAYTTDPDDIQALANYLGGWYSAVVGSNSPAIQDMNALFYLYAYQLAYLFQAGVAEWKDTTTYYIGSLASDGIGGIYTSIEDDNTGNALTDGTYWKKITGQSALYIDASGDSPWDLDETDNGKTFLIDTSTAAMVFNLPAVPIDNFQFTVKDISGAASTNTITIVKAASEAIEGLSADYACESDFGAWTFLCDDDGNYWLTN